MCRQMIERRTFAIRPKSDCSAAILETDRARAEGHLRLTTFDRAKRDVILAQRSEMFAWPGKGKFDAKNPDDLLHGGLSGTGDFASFVINIFTVDDVTFNYEGACAPDSCVRYSYHMPLEASAYVLRTRTTEATVGYHGTFDVDPRTAELLRASVIPIEPEKAFPKVCELQTEMVFTRSNTKSGEFMIPKSTFKNLLIADGHYLENVNTYEGCHEYTTESVLTSGETAPGPNESNPRPVARQLPPPGTRLDLRLTSKIDTDSASEGDTLEGALTKDLRDASGGLIAPAGTIFRGHLDRLQHIHDPRQEIIIGIQFDSIVLAGTELPLVLAATRDMDVRGVAIFRFRESRVTLGGRFVSHWAVREPVR